MAQRWYVVHVYSGFEKKTAETIREQSVVKGVEQLVTEVLVPSEEIVEVRRGSKVKVEKKFFPGYILVKMEMTNESWDFVKNTAKVTDFLGSSGKPFPISKEEVERILSQMREGTKSVQDLPAFDIGDQVRVSDGPFVSFSGSVETIDPERSRIKVLVSIFGRATPIDLDFAQVEKL